MNNFFVCFTGIVLLAVCSCKRRQPPAPALLPVQVSALNIQAESFYQTNIDSIKFYADSAYTTAAQNADSLGMATAATHLCEFYRRNGAFERAVDKILEARRIFQHHNKPRETAGALVQTAVLYKEMGGEKKTVSFLQQGLDECKKALDIYYRMADTAGILNTYSAQGIIYRDLARINNQRFFYDTAFNLYSRALHLQTLSGHGGEHLGKLYNNMSQVYIEHKKNYDSGLVWLNRALQFNLARNNLMSLTYNYGNIASAWMKKGQPDTSLVYARMGLQLSSRNHMPHRLVNAYHTMYGVWMQKNRPDSAIVYLNKHYALYDSITNLAKTGQISEMQTRFETREKEASITALNTINRNKSKSIMWLSLLLGAIALLCGLAWWLYRRSQKQQTQIAAQSKKLELMMQELHHRVKNNLQIVSSLLSLQTYRVKDEKALEAIQESRHRVQAMSLIHQRLYKTDQVTAVNIKEYLTDLAEQLMTGFGYGPDSFTLHIEAEEALLDVDKALPLGLIVNEVATNAFKYAYKNTSSPELRIQLLAKGNDLVLTVADNGAGMDMNVWNGSHRSFGRQLIATLSKQLRAQQQIDTDNGTRFTFIIPRAA